jgi:hypothetical protein
MYVKEETDSQREHMKHNEHHQQQNHHQEPISNQYSVNLHFDSIVPEAGRKTMLTITVPKQPIRGFSISTKLYYRYD